jgi:hypothetical protein
MSAQYSNNLLSSLQQRLTYAEGAIAYLTNEVQRLSNHSQQGFQTAIPLQPSQPVQGRRPYAPRPRAQPAPPSSPVTPAQTQQDVPPPMPLSEILETGETVTFGIHTGRDAQGGVTTSFLLTTFDGTDLTVTECSTVSSLVGTKSSKPGEILFKFMHGLVDAGHLQRTFNALPWRLASVMRDGQRMTLAQLRRDKQGDTQDQ